jgi:hypothetical protein
MAVGKYSIALDVILILGVCILLRVWDPGDGVLFRLRVTIVGYF